MTSEIHSVCGRKYRWNYLQDALEHHEWGDPYWTTSVFTGFVKDAAAGIPFDGEPSIRAQAEALIAVFAPLVLRHTITTQ